MSWFIVGAAKRRKRSVNTEISVKVAVTRCRTWHGGAQRWEPEYCKVRETRDNLDTVKYVTPEITWLLKGA